MKHLVRSTNATGPAKRRKLAAELRAGSRHVMLTRWPPATVPFSGRRRASTNRPAVITCRCGVRSQQTQNITRT